LDPRLEKIIQNVEDPNSEVDFPIASGFNGEVIKFQLKGALFLYVVKRSLLHDATGLGKTVEMGLSLHMIQNSRAPLDTVIWATTSGGMSQLTKDLDTLFAVDGHPLYRAHVVTNAPPKGAQRMRGPDYRKLQYFNNIVNGRSLLLVMNYSQITRDYRSLMRALKGRRYALVLDECHTFKNPDTKLAEALRSLQTGADRVHGLTATPVMKELSDVYGIYSVLDPDWFPSLEWFEDAFCRIKKIKLRGRRRTVKKIVGYKNIGALREMMHGRHLGREAEEVAHQMEGAFPEPLIKIRHCGMYPHQRTAYERAEDGLVILESGIKETTVLSKLIYCQLFLSNFPHYGDARPTAKMDELLEVVRDEFSNEKIVVFTKFATVASALQTMLKRAGIPTVKITGDEKADQKERNRIRFQESTIEDCRVMIITRAGGQSLNLQSSRVLIYYDMSYNAGVDRQVRGRILRYKSEHPVGLVIYMITPGTIEEDVYATCMARYQLAAAVRGKDAPGEIITETDSQAILRRMKERRGARIEPGYFEATA